MEDATSAEQLPAWAVSTAAEATVPTVTTPAALALVPPPFHKGTGDRLGLARPKLLVM